MSTDEVDTQVQAERMFWANKIILVLLAVQVSRDPLAKVYCVRNPDCSAACLDGLREVDDELFRHA